MHLAHRSICKRSDGGLGDESESVVRAPEGARQARHSKSIAAYELGAPTLPACTAKMRFHSLRPASGVHNKTANRLGQEVRVFGKNQCGESRNLCGRGARRV